MHLFVKKGQALVEMMVGLGIAAAIMPAIVTSFFAARGGSAQEEVRLMASARMREAREVLSLVKNDNWAALADGVSHPVLNSNVWSLASGSESNLDGQFTRSITLSPAYRTLTNQLTTISSGNTLDPSVKHVSISVSWTSPIASSVTTQYYLMRLENLTYLETLLSHFTAPGVVHRSTVATSSSGGEIVLGGSGSGVGNWCNPSLTLQTLDLNHSSVPTSISAIEGHAYATTGENASGDPLTSINITNPAPPTQPVPTEGGSYNPNPQPKAYGLFAASNYVYLATSKKMVDIINPSNMTRVGSFDPAGNKTGDSVYVAGTVGYVSSGTTLYSFDLSGSINPAPQIASATLAGSSKRLSVVGDYVYVATSNATKQLQIFHKDTLVEVGSGLNLGNGQGGVDLYVESSGDYAYIITSYASPDFFAIDLSTNSVVGSYTTASSMDPRGLAVVPQDDVAIIVGSGSDLYQVLQIGNPSSPSRCGTPLTLPGVSTLHAISSVTEADGDAYSYILTDDASKEFQMIQGGPGGGGGGSALTGVFDSQPFTAGGLATFNRFDASVTFPAGTYARYQVAVTNQVGGSCTDANYTFVGPGIDPTQWFSGSSQIPLGSGTGYSNPGECFKYRVSLSTDNLGTTPVFSDITINYSL